MKYTLDQIEGMLENFKSPDWDFMLQSQKKLYAASPQIISDLVEEVKALKNELKIAEAEIKRLQDIPRITHTHINAIRGTKEKIEL
jgi:hypothetical protein